ncbi:MAG: hypothetical protein ACYS1C_08605 [Planctomycetota bacterium]
MGSELKPDLREAQERVEAWWSGEMLDRVPVRVTAPLREVSEPEPLEDELDKWWTDPEWVIPRLEARAEATCWGGEAVPVVFPVVTTMVAVLAAYLGCPYHFSGTTTAWADPIIRDWDDAPPLAFDPDSQWWRRSAALLQAAAERAPGRYFVGLPDLNGAGEILARLRGTEQLLLDLVEAPERILPALEALNMAWHRYYEAALDIVHQRVPGSICWMGIWSLTPAADLQCDFSCMISPGMFAELFLPALRQQTEWVPRTIYHLDGPDAVRHLDSLLALPDLSGIQWVPGAGAPRMSEWTDLLRRVLEAGKLLYISCEADEVERLLRELPHRGLLLDTRCATPLEVDELLAMVARLS